jgi:hypothetical protein
MPKLEYFLVCESVSIDKDTNRVSIFHVVEEFRPLQATENALVVTQLVAVCCWYEEADDAGKDFQTILRLCTPDGKERDFPMNFQMKSRRQRLLFQLQGVPPLSPGDLTFEVWLNGKRQASHIVTVHPPESVIGLGATESQNPAC